MLRILSRYTRLGGGLLRKSCPAIRPRPYSSTLLESPQVSYLLADSLIPKCTSCGITLQNNNNQAVGYYKHPSHSQPRKVAKPADKIYESSLAKLSEEDRVLLLNGAPASLPSKPKPQPVRVESRGHTCIRCRNAEFQSSFDASQHKVDSVSAVLSSLPPTANIVYVVSATDFPMSLDSQVFRFKPASSIHFAITKSDLFFDRNTSASKVGLTFFQDYLHQKYNVPPERVHLVSGQADWNTDRLYEAIPNNSFFIGSVNSGKSTLLRSLVYVGQKGRDSLPNARNERNLQKAQNHLHAVPQRKKHVAEMQKLKALRGPGVSYMPGFTRGIMAVELTKKKIMYDVPGFDINEEASRHFLDILSPNAIKQLNKGKKTHKYGTFKSSYETAKAGQVITVGGLFFMQVPEGCMYRVRNLINHKMHIFSSMEKALQVWRDAKDKKAVHGLFLADGEKARLVKYRVPEFLGSFDLVIGSIGYINVTATGALPADPTPLHVYLPEGIRGTWRDPIAKYLAKSLSGKDKHGNSLRKENWVKSSTKILKRLPKDAIFTQDLVKVPEDAVPKA